MKPEQGLWLWLKSHLDKQGVFSQRIETTTGVGVPDVFVAKDGKMAFIELKAMLGNRTGIRPAQAAWHAQAHRAGVPVFIMNRDKASGEIAVWRAPVALAETAEKPDHHTLYGRKIISEPLFRGPPALAAEKLQLILKFK